MMRFVLKVISAVVALALAMIPTGALAERRVALVIGNAGYRNVPVLANTVNDATAMAALFAQAKFDVVNARQDLGVLEFKRAVRDFINTVRDADIAVMYYAGHGLEAGGVNYLIPVDARLASDYDAEDEAVALDRVIMAMQPARRLRLIILDACRDNPFLQKLQRTVAVRAVTTGLAKVEPMETDTLIAFAAKAGSVSFDGTGHHSPFTTALMRHITEPGVDIRIALGKVRDDVLKETANRQEPFVYGSLGGATVSLVPAPEPKIANPAADPSLEVRIDYELAERVATKEAWESFLAIHNSGFYADLARAQLGKLKAVPAPALAPGAGAEPPQAAQETALRHDVNAPQADEQAAACRRDADRLNWLRANPEREEAARFARDLSCNELRPQVLRLLESLSLPAAAIAPPATPAPARAPHSGGQTPAAGTASPPSAEVEPRTWTRPLKQQSEVCRRDEARLARLRADPSREEAMRLARELVCEDLRPQVARLLESLE